MVTKEQVLRARESFKYQFPKFKVGVSGNGDKGYKLVATVETDENAKLLPEEIEGVPVDVRINAEVAQKKK